MTTTTIMLIGGVAVLIFWAVGAYNRLIRLKNTIANAFGQIDVQLRRRYELIPDMVEAARTYVSHERDTLEAVIAARHQAKSDNDTARANPASAVAVTTLAAAEQALSSSLVQLFALNEANPELAGDQAINDLSEELTRTENQVAFARQAFNDAVLDYNNARGQFPAVLIAKLFSFSPSAMFQSTQSTDERESLKRVV